MMPMVNMQSCDDSVAMFLQLLATQMQRMEGNIVQLTAKVDDLALALQRRGVDTEIQSGQVGGSQQAPPSLTLSPDLFASISKTTTPTSEGDSTNASSSSSIFTAKPAVQEAQTTTTTPAGIVGLPKQTRARPQRSSQPVPVTPPPRRDTSEAGSEKPTGARLYLWGNAWHQVPEDFEIPKESLEVIWRQWCCGDTSRGYIPLRQLETSDMATVNARKRLSDLRFLMRHIENALQQRGVWKSEPSLIEADQMLRAVAQELPIAGSTGKNSKKRQLDTLKWHTAVTILRGANQGNKKAKRTAQPPLDSACV
ncbi:hypothetical protein PINS_up004892 [Pythium insidiosum]|nr:hypothetical protein PINS_up004892 [Pythium insidiosum]